VRFVVVCLLLFSCAARAGGGEQSLLLNGVHAAVWTPAGEGRVPLIVFSHGFHGCSTQASFLMAAFAAAGYLVVAPDHRDSGCRGGMEATAQAPFREPTSWTDATYRDRAEDVRRVIEALTADARFATRIDRSRVGLIGHSLGGYTVLGLAGAWASWHMPEAKAVLALSPYTAPFVVKQTLRELSVPVMYQGGTLDLRVTPAVRQLDGAFDQSPPPKYYVELEGAGHFAWTDVGRSDHETIVRYSIAFMNHYVKGESADPILNAAQTGLAAFRHSE
jgi:predicted dienelactone hydrolase